MNIPGSMSGASERLLSKQGGRYILRAYANSQLRASFIGPLINLYFIFITANLTGVQFIEFVISMVAFITLDNILLSIYVLSITKTTRKGIEHHFQSQPIPNEIEKDLAWDEVKKLPGRASLMHSISAVCTVVLPIVLFMRWFGNISWSQIIPIVIGTSICEIAILIQSTLSLDQLLIPVRQVLKPAEMSQANIQFSLGQRSRVYMMSSILLTGILSTGTLGYYYILAAINSSAGTPEVINHYLLQLLIIGSIIFLLDLFLLSRLLQSIIRPTKEVVRIMEQVKEDRKSVV
jgi:hypothetical protein